MRIDYNKMLADAMRDLDAVNKRISELKEQKKEQDEYEKQKAIETDLDDIMENGIVDFSDDNFANIMRAIYYQKNEEEAHILADHVMVSFLRHLGYVDGCDIFENIQRWYS